MKRKGRRKWQPENLDQVREMAARGLTMTQIASALGISRSTAFARMIDNPDFSDSIKEGQATGLHAVANALYEHALAGNVTAMIFYLKSRAPEQWLDVARSEPAQNVVIEQVERALPVDEATLVRMAHAYVKTRGISICDVSNPATST